MSVYHYFYWQGSTGRGLSSGMESIKKHHRNIFGSCCCCNPIFHEAEEILCNLMKFDVFAFRKSFLYCYDWLILLANRSTTPTSSCVCYSPMCHTTTLHLDYQQEVSVMTVPQFVLCQHKKPQLLSYCWWSWLGHSNACSWRYNYTKTSLVEQTPLCSAPKQINLYMHVLKSCKRRF